MDECDWIRCAAPARLDVLLGQSFADAGRVGSFCVPHASLTSIDTQDQSGEPTWYDWHRRHAEREPADGSLGRAPARAVIPLFRSAHGQRRRFPPAHPLAETDVGGP